MKIKHQLSLESLKKALENITSEEIEKYFPKDTKSKGWISIEEYLPKWMAADVKKGYSKYKIKFEDGAIGETKVTDHSIWYYDAKKAGVTYWWNEK